MPTILVVEDEPDAADLLALNLKAAGYEVTTADTGTKGLKCAQTIRPDLIVLDHMLPGMSGIEVCRSLRAAPETADVPVIMLTARAAESDRVKGFECGADDYVTKPFSMKELLLRVQTRLKRRSATLSSAQQMKVGDLAIDLMNQTVNVAGEEIRLTSTEMKLISMLARTPGQTVPRQTLLREVWQYNETSDTRTVDSHVRRLRSKLGPLAAYVETVQGVGYRLTVPLNS